MGNIAAALGHHVHRRAFAAPVRRRKALRRNIELLDGFERQLHYRPAHRTVLVVDAIDRHVDVAPTRTVGGEHAHAVFGRVVRIDRARPRREHRQTHKVPSIGRQVDDFGGADRTAHIGFLNIHQRRAGRLHRNHFSLLAGIQRGVHRGRAPHARFHLLKHHGRETLHADPYFVDARRQQVELIQSGVAGNRGPLQPRLLVADPHFRVRNDGLALVHHRSTQRRASCALREQIPRAQAHQRQRQSDQDLLSHNPFLSEDGLVLFPTIAIKTAATGGAPGFPQNKDVSDSV